MRTTSPSGLLFSWGLAPRPLAKGPHGFKSTLKMKGRSPPERDGGLTIHIMGKPEGDDDDLLGLHRCMQRRKGIGGSQLRKGREWGGSVSVGGAVKTSLVSYS